MCAFKKSVCNASLPISQNENGGFCYKESGDPRVDYFSGITRGAKQEYITLLLDRCWDISKLDTLKLIFQKRDCRGGSGERDIFITSYNWLFKKDLQVFIKNLKRVPEYGSFKDWCYIAEYNEETIEHICNSFACQLHADRHTNTTSLCAKYAPSENKKFDRNVPLLIPGICKLMGFSTVHMRRDYRRMLTVLRRKLDIVETKICNNDWYKIDYSTIPSCALNAYADKLQAYAEPEKEVHIGQVHPHNIAGSYMTCRDRGSNVLIESQWSRLVSETSDKYNLCNTVVMADISSSLTGLPLRVSATMAALIAKASARQGSCFGDFIVMFSQNPLFVNIEQHETLKDLISIICKVKADNSKTNLYNAFKTMIERAECGDVGIEEFPSKVVILTDMQFDSVNDQSTMQYINELFDASSYVMPHLIFWNLRSTGNYAVSIYDTNVTMVSGYSPVALDVVLKCRVVTPYTVMRTTIDDARYSSLEI